MRLHVFDIEKIDNLVFKEVKGDLTKESSIMEIFTDFKQVPPMIIDDHAHAFPVREIMKSEHMNMKVVVDSDNMFKGILPLARLTEEQLSKKVLDGYDEDSLLVKHCMIAKKDLHALDYHEILKASIGEVIEALQHIGSRYCLVVDHKAHEIRGVISANDISRALHMNIEISSTGVGTSFLDIFLRMKGGS